MNKKLPSVFANKINSDASHNKKYSYTSNDGKEITNKIEKNDDKIVLNYQNVNQKINSIFSSTKYVYKADVNITLKDQIIKRRIIGKNSVYLITIDNELIPISDIVDIEFAN